jgi:hypothetical protein
VCFKVLSEKSHRLNLKVKTRMELCWNDKYLIFEITLTTLTLSDANHKHSNGTEFGLTQWKRIPTSQFMAWPPYTYCTVLLRYVQLLNIKSYLSYFLPSCMIHNTINVTNVSALGNNIQFQIYLQDLSPCSATIGNNIKVLVQFRNFNFMIRIIQCFCQCTNWHFPAAVYIVY